VEEGAAADVEMHEANTTALLVEAQAAYTELQEAWLQVPQEEVAT